MSVIKVKCVDQTLTVTKAPLIAAGGTDENHVEFDFCNMWDGFQRIAVFYNKPSKKYKNIIDENNSCPIPPEVTKTRGNMYFGVFGTNNSGVTRTSEVVCYRIDEGAIESGAEPSDPTPDMWEQLLAQIQEANEKSLNVVISDKKPGKLPAIWFNTAGEAPTDEGQLLSLGEMDENAALIAEIDRVSYSVKNVSSSVNEDGYNYDII